MWREKGMLLDSPLVGKRIVLRSVQERDAEFIVTLRTNPALNQFIHDTDPSVEKQQEWTRAQQQRAGDYYMIIEDLEKHSLGTVGVYNVNQEEKSFEWGRWLIVPGAPFYVAAESALMVYSFAFRNLLLETAVFVVKTRNITVCNYFKTALRSEVIEQDDEDTWFRFQKKGFAGLLAKFKEFHRLEWSTGEGNAGGV